MTAPECDTVAGFTMSAPVEHSLAWSDSDDPYLVDCPADLYDHSDAASERESFGAWAFVIGAWLVGALAVAVVIGWAYVTFYPTPPPPPQQPQPVTSTYPTSDGITPGGDIIPE